MELIEQVRLRPCLWDRACAAYRSRNRAAKQQAWRDVCRALHSDYDRLPAADKHEMGVVMMRKWYNIRDAFKKSYSSKGHAAHSRPYLYADQLTFLIPIFEGRTKERAESVKYETVEDTDRDDGHEEWLSVLELDQAEPAPTPTPTPPKHTKPKELAEADDSFASVLMNIIEKEDDEDRAFFRSITPAVKSLPEELKFTFRIRVMRLLNNMKNSNPLSKTDGSTPEGTDSE